MKRPSFQFYPGDWAANPNLKRCTFAEKGIWLEVMCLMHDQPEYGILRWPAREIAEAVKCKPGDLQALIRKGVMKGGDEKIDAPFVYVPRTGRKDGEPVTLVPPQVGPVWYSSRMVKDEHVRIKRGESDGNGGTPKPPPSSAPKPTNGEDFVPRGSSSPSSPSGEEIEPRNTLVLVGTPAAPPTYRRPNCPTQSIVDLYHEALPAFPRVEVLTPGRKSHVSARWAAVCGESKYDRQQGLDWFAWFFGHVAKSRFLTGQVKGRSGDYFRCTFEFLMTPEKFARVIENFYHKDSA